MVFSLFFKLFRRSPFGFGCLLLLIFPNPLDAMIDYVTDNPKLLIVFDESKIQWQTPAVTEKVSKAKDLIYEYYRDWQDRFGKIRRNLKINLVPVERQISVTGGLAEGVWAWTSYENEPGTLVLGISGNLFLNINSTTVSQEALIAHECSHAFLLTYHPKLLQVHSNFTIFNEGLAELFAVDYEPKPWREWRKLIIAKRTKELFDSNLLSIYGQRLLFTLEENYQSIHNVGFFFTYVVRKKEVSLEKDLKECNNLYILKSVKEWIKNHPEDFDVPFVHDSSK